MPVAHKKELHNNDKIATAERRSHLRFPFTASVEAIEPKSGTRIRGRSTDLGLGGCYVDTLNPFATGTVVKIRIEKQKESFEAQAMVIFSQVGMGMGLSFIAAQPQQTRLFHKWVLELSGEAPAADSSHEQTEKEDGHAKEELKSEQFFVLNELVIALMRKGVLDEADGRAMLRKLHG